MLRFLLIFISFSLMAKERLNIYAWANLIPDEIIREFEREHNIYVNLSTYASNETLYAKLKANPDADYDLILPSSYVLERMIKNDMLQKIERSLLSNYHNIDPKFLNLKHDLKNEYQIPYLWSSTGILVNSKEHKEEISTWAHLWQQKYFNSLVLLDDTREIFALALLSMGQSVNTKDKLTLETAFLRLKKLMPNVKLFNTESLRSIYIDEDINLGMIWSGDAFLAHKENPALKFIFPLDGFVISLDSFAIPKAAKNLRAAHLFINFILRADIAIKIANTLGFSSTNLALKNSPLSADPIIYPKAEVMQRAQFLEDIEGFASIYEKYFELLKLS